MVLENNTYGTADQTGPVPPPPPVPNPTPPTPLPPTASGLNEPVPAVSPPQPSQPPVNLPQQPVMQPPSQAPGSPVVSNSITDVPPKPADRRWLKPLLLVVAAAVLLASALGGAFFMGKRQAKIIYQKPPAQPINLPAQAVVVADCLPGRGKQYVLPEDIPEGPIYDVENSKVIAIEFSLSLKDIQSNPDSLPNIILKLVRDYPVDNFKLVPAQQKEGEPLENIHLILFVVPQSEASQITCEDSASS